MLHPYGMDTQKHSRHHGPDSPHEDMVVVAKNHRRCKTDQFNCDPRWFSFWTWINDFGEGIHTGWRCFSHRWSTDSWITLFILLSPDQVSFLCKPLKCHKRQSSIPTSVLRSFAEDGQNFKPPQLVTKDDPLWPLVPAWGWWLGDDWQSPVGLCSCFKVNVQEFPSIYLSFHKINLHRCTTKEKWLGWSRGIVGPIDRRWNWFPSSSNRLFWKPLAYDQTTNGTTGQLRVLVVMSFWTRKTSLPVNCTGRYAPVLTVIVSMCTTPSYWRWSVVTHRRWLVDRNCQSVVWPLNVFLCWFRELHAVWQFDIREVDLDLLGWSGLVFVKKRCVKGMFGKSRIRGHWCNNCTAMQVMLFDLFQKHSKILQSFRFQNLLQTICFKVFFIVFRHRGLVSPPRDFWGHGSVFGPRGPSLQERSQEFAWRLYQHDAKGFQALALGGQSMECFVCCFRHMLFAGVLFVLPLFLWGRGVGGIIKRKGTNRC